MRLNPFAGHGIAVFGERLVGREQIVEEVLETVAPCAGSVALVGLPRIGKSSVATEVLNRCTDIEGVETRWIDASTRCIRQGVASAILQELSGDDHVGRGDAVERLLRSALRERRTAGGHVVVVIDEFDAIRRRSDGDDCIRFLREVVYRPTEFRLAVVLVSRRPLKSIQQKFNDLSTLAGVCHSIAVPPLDVGGLQAMIRRGWVDDEPISAVDLARQTCGQPLLAEQLLAGFWRQDSAESIENLRRRGQEDLCDDYFSLFQSMAESESHLEEFEFKSHLRQFGMNQRLRPEFSSLSELYQQHAEQRGRVSVPWDTELALRQQS